MFVPLQFVRCAVLLKDLPRNEDVAPLLWAGLCDTLLPRFDGTVEVPPPAVCAHTVAALGAREEGGGRDGEGREDGGKREKVRWDERWVERRGKSTSLFSIMENKTTYHSLPYHFLSFLPSSDPPSFLFPPSLLSPPPPPPSPLAPRTCRAKRSSSKSQ